MLGSMFPEKIQILNGQPRTARLNSVFEIILLRHKELREQKKGQNRKKSSLSRLVEVTGDNTNFLEEDLRYFYSRKK